MYIFRETDDYLAVSTLFEECGLEVTASAVAKGKVVRLFGCFDEETGELLAASHLGHRDGAYVLEGLAVKKGIRKGGLGTKCLEMAVEDAKKLGAKEIWACARVPEYYTGHGWEIIEDLTDIPKVSHCLKCPRFRTECHPEIIRITL